MLLEFLRRKVQVPALGEILVDTGGNGEDFKVLLTVHGFIGNTTGEIREFIGVFAFILINFCLLALGDSSCSSGSIGAIGFRGIFRASGKVSGRD